LFLVRHGRTAWNEAGRFQGQTDVPLSEGGRAQARSAAASLKRESLERILSSDLSRALETAELIAERRGLAVERDVRLRERDFGEWEGLTWAQILERYPPHADANWADPGSYVAPGGEAFESVIARVSCVLDELRSLPQRRVLVVTHAGATHAAMRALFGAHSPTLGMRLDPTSITHIRFESGAPEVVRINDTTHLARAAI
jgi:alpha-ribazole phosphatase